MDPVHQVDQRRCIRRASRDDHDSGDVGAVVERGRRGHCGIRSQGGQQGPVSGSAASAGRRSTMNAALASPDASRSKRSWPIRSGLPSIARRSMQIPSVMHGIGVAATSRPAVTAMAYDHGCRIRCSAHRANCPDSPASLSARGVCASSTAAAIRCGWKRNTGDEISNPALSLWIRTGFRALEAVRLPRGSAGFRYLELLRA